MPIPVGACEVWFAYQMTGDNELMYTHCAFNTIDAADQASVDAGFDDWQTNWKPLHANDVSLVGGHVLIGNDGGSVRWDSSIAPESGTSAGLSVPNNTAYLVRKSTASGGRRNRGRMFIPGVPEALCTGAGTLTVAAITAVNAATARLFSGGSINTAFGFLGSPQILHSSGSQTPTLVTDLSCQNKVATQRRRMRK